MDWLRQTIGLEARPPPRKPNQALERRRGADERSHAERLAAQVHDMRVRVRVAEAECADLKEEARADLREGNRVAAQSKLAEAKVLAQQAQQNRSKLRNLEQQQSRIQTANANLDQALLVDEGATELQDAVDAMEQIDLEDAVDRVRDASDRVGDHDDLLTKPMFRDLLVDPDEVDDELARMEAQMADEALMGISNPPPPPVAVTTKETAPPADKLAH